MVSLVFWVFSCDPIFHFGPNFSLAKTLFFCLILVSLDRLFNYLSNENKIMQIRGDLGKL